MGPAAEFSVDHVETEKRA